MYFIPFRRKFSVWYCLRDRWFKLVFYYILLKIHHSSLKPLVLRVRIHIINRELRALWHQARLGTLPLDPFIHPIKSRKDRAVWIARYLKRWKCLIRVSIIFRSLSYFGQWLKKGYKTLNLNKPPRMKRKVTLSITYVIKKMKIAYNVLKNNSKHEESQITGTSKSLCQEWMTPTNRALQER